jgi:DnaJ family protein C protein 28
MRSIDEIIKNAMEQGAFENLKGKGKPLSLEDNPHLDPEWQLAYHMLKQNGFAPEFIERRQEIEMELAQARTALMRTWAWSAGALSERKDAELADAEWAKAKKVFLESVEKINGKIKTYNLGIPTQTLYRKPVNAEAEMSQLTGE